VARHRHADAFRPNRDRQVSAALRAYAAMTTSAAEGAGSQIERKR
jgi:dihydroxy-acid dehydratase